MFGPQDRVMGRCRASRGRAQWEFRGSRGMLSQCRSHTTLWVLLGKRIKQKSALLVLVSCFLSASSMRTGAPARTTFSAPLLTPHLPWVPHHSWPDADSTFMNLPNCELKISFLPKIMCQELLTGMRSRQMCSAARILSGFWEMITYISTLCCYMKHFHITYHLFLLYMTTVCTVSKTQLKDFIFYL